jgi:hypothetical protein
VILQKVSSRYCSWRLAVGEARELLLPLVLERGGAHHQHALHAEVAREELGRGDRLNCLSQPHLVADQHPARARGEQCAFGLERVEPDLQQFGERPVLGALGIGLGQRCVAAFAVTDLGDELPDVIVDFQLVAAPLRGLQQSVQPALSVAGQRPACSDIEQRLRARHQGRRAIGASAKAHPAHAGVVKPDFAVRRHEPTCQRGLAAALALQPGERELDVLAGAQVIGGEIRTGAEILSQCAAADRHAIARAAVGVMHPEVGEHRFAAEILEVETLLAAKLAAQRALPVGNLEIRRPARARQARFGRGFGSARRSLRGRLAYGARWHGGDAM